MIVYLEKIAPPSPLPREAADELSLRRTSRSIEPGRAWLKAQLDRLLGK